MYKRQILLGDEFQSGRGLAVDQAAVSDAALGVDGGNDVLGNIHLAVVSVTASLELARVGHDKVAGGEVGYIFVHVKAVGKGDRHSEQHHGQG